MSRPKRKRTRRGKRGHVEPAQVDRQGGEGQARPCLTKGGETEAQGGKGEHVEPAQGEIESPLLTAEEVGRYLRVSRSTVDRWGQSGRLPGRVKVGFLVFYHRDLVERWLLDQVRQTQEVKG